MFNPKRKLAQSKGLDLPLMYVYLAGYMSGEKLEETMAWRKFVRKHYEQYETEQVENPFYIPNDEFTKPFIDCNVSYPICFLDPYNGKEFKTIDKKGLTSSIPPNAIYHGDRMSVNRADVIVANMDDFMTSDIEDLMNINAIYEIGKSDIVGINNAEKDLDFKEAFFKLQEVIKKRRPLTGTIFEICWAFESDKPVVLIVPEDKRENYELHPFTRQASQIVGSIEELIEGQVLETFYRRIAGAIY